MIIIKNLEKWYRNFRALEIDELIIEQGEFLGIVGNNGAGKTTFLRLLLDLIKADKGTITSSNSIVSSSTAWKLNTASYLDEGFLIDFLTPEEFFHFTGNAYGFRSGIIDEKLRKYEAFFNNEILGKKKKYIRDFSRGNKQKIGICAALMVEPRVLVLDEPFNGLDPSSQVILNQLLLQENTIRGTTIILSSHDLSQVTEVCKKIAVIEKGQIIRNIVNSDHALSELRSYFSLGKILENDFDAPDK